jgi:hypothetical protein
MRWRSWSWVWIVSLAAGACSPAAAPDLCLEVDCSGHGACLASTGACRCAPGHVGEACQFCAAGWVETAQGCRCAAGQAAFGESCFPEGCLVPRAPSLTEIHAGAELVFSTPDQAALEVGSAWDPRASAPDTWQPADRIVMPAVEQPTAIVVFSRRAEPACQAGPWFRAAYALAQGYPGPAGADDSTALPRDDAAFVAWASAWVEPVGWGTELDPDWKHPEQALGPAQGSSESVVSLGRGGQLTLTFDVPIADGPGADFAVFENGLNDAFLELAFVEVSSDGDHFLRFDGVQLDGQAIDAFGTLDTRGLGGLAGKYRQGFGQPYDLAALANRPEAASRQVDLGAIRFVRLVDIVGDGATLDCFGQPIYDPYPTTGSAGFDLDAIGVLHRGD